MGFSDKLREEASQTWEAIFSHPFVVGIGDGTLPLERFRYYVGQDYVFLVEFARALAVGAAKSPSLSEVTFFLDLAHETTSTEMSLHRGYAAKFGLSGDDLALTAPSPTTYAYTRHLLSTAYSGTSAELLAAILPCMWTYPEIGSRLAPVRATAEQPLYREWIDMYASLEFATLSATLRARVDDMAAQASGAEQARMREHFKTSSQYEYLFWDAALKMEAWPA